MTYLKAVWRGEERLVITFWAYYAVGAVIFDLVYRYGSLDIGSTKFILAANLVFMIFFIVSIWRSAENYQGNILWKQLARVMTVIVALHALFLITALLGGLA